jgi:maleate cis-trans isomerase
MDRADYGVSGLLGVLTPQANTTVEPEFWTLMPPGWSAIAARLTSDKPTMEARLADYTARYADTVEEFANAPLTAVAAACTGASYLIGKAAEAELVAAVEARRGVPFLTAALAVTAALRAMGARRLALLTPYPDSLNGPSVAYWSAQGFEIVAAAGPQPERGAFHPIYAMRSPAVLRAYEDLSGSGADAVLMLGTGMATLRPILAGRASGLTPAISSNLALAWAATQGRRWDALDTSTLPAWMAGTHWAPRLELLFPTA